jgi:hypothetical protein
MQNDARLAEFRDNWIKAHEALQHSRELLARKDAQLAQLRGDWNAAQEAFRLSQELLAQKEAQLTELLRQKISSPQVTV